MEDYDKIKAIEDLLAGDLSPEQERKLREELASDDALQVIARQEQDLVDGIKHWSKEQLRNQLRELEKGLEPVDQTTDSDKKEGGFNWKPLLAAASIVLIVALYFVINTLGSPSHEELFQNYYEPYTTYAPVTMRGDGGDITPMEQALGAYEAGNYDRAAEQLEALAPGEQRDFYLAHSYMALGEESRATPLLEQLAETSAEPASTINWYLALAYLKSDNTEQSREILHNLASYDNSYKAKARQLLKDM